MGERPVTLQSPLQTHENLSLAEQLGSAQESQLPSDPILEPRPHEGRLLQLMPNFTGSLVNVSVFTNSTHALSDRHNNSSSAHNHSALLQPSGHSVLPAQHTDAPPTANANSSTSTEGSQAGSMHNELPTWSSDTEDMTASVTAQPSHTNAAHNFSANSETSASLPLVSAHTADSIRAHVTHRTAGLPDSHGSDQISTSQGFQVCEPHTDLPIPGMDIAPANQSKCYAHPPQYRSDNYLNDSYYMLYHHDMLPTTGSHPAFTWGDISRFMHAMYKMKRNDPMKAIFVGGSVSSSYCRQANACHHSACWLSVFCQETLQHNLFFCLLCDTHD